MTLYIFKKPHIYFIEILLSFTLAFAIPFACQYYFDRCEIIACQGWDQSTYTLRPSRTPNVNLTFSMPKNNFARADSYFISFCGDCYTCTDYVIGTSINCYYWRNAEIVSYYCFLYVFTHLIIVIFVILLSHSKDGDSLSQQLKRRWSRYLLLPDVSHVYTIKNQLQSNLNATSSFEYVSKLQHAENRSCLTKIELCQDILKQYSSLKWSDLDETSFVNQFNKLKNFIRILDRAHDD
jgi:hypothetical protein